MDFYKYTGNILHFLTWICSIVILVLRTFYNRKEQKVMRKHTRLIALLLSIAMLLSILGCGNAAVCH